MKSRAQKTPIIAVSISRMQIMNSFTRCSIAFQEQRTQRGEIMAVSTISMIEMPSTPST